MKLKWVRRARGSGDWRERGTAIVEFAVVLPLLLTILFGIIEFGYVFMVRQSLQHAAREGARTAILQTSTNAGVTARITEAMGPTGITGYTVARTLATNANPVETVSVTVPYTDVSLVGGFFGFANFNLNGTCSMRKEGMTGGA